MKPGALLTGTLLIERPENIPAGSDRKRRVILYLGWKTWNKFNMYCYLMSEEGGGACIQYSTTFNKHGWDLFEDV